MATIKKNNLIAAIYDYKEFNHALGICNITGIAVELKIPQIEGMEAIDYKNPLAYPLTAEKFAKQSQKELEKLPLELLAGILLSLLYHKRLTDKIDKTSAIEKNVIIRNNFNDFQVIEAIKKAVRIPINKESLYPTISFESFLITQGVGSVSRNILDTLQESLSMAYPTTEFSNKESENMNKILAAIPKAKKPSISEINSEAKIWIRSLQDAGLISTNIAQKFRAMFSNENIIATGKRNRQKAIDFLDSIDFTPAQKLSNLFKIIQKFEDSMHVETLDLTFTQQVEKEKEEKKAKEENRPILSPKEKLLAILNKNKEIKTVENKENPDEL